MTAPVQRQQPLSRECFEHCSEYQLSEVWETDIPHHRAAGVSIHCEYAFVGFLDVLDVSEAQSFQTVSVAKAKKVYRAMVDVPGSSGKVKGERSLRRVESNTEPAKEPTSSRQDESHKGMAKENSKPKIANGVQRITSDSACSHEWVIDTDRSTDSVEAYKCSNCGAPASVRFMKAGR